MEHSINKPMLFRYLANRATPLERQALEEWLKKAGDTDTFHQWLLEWEMQSPQYLPNSETAYHALVERIDSQEAGTLEAEQITMGRRRLAWLNWRIAATVTVLLIASAWLLRKPILYKTYETEYGQTSSFVLQDGSRVTLNANSTLKVPRFGFGNDHDTARFMLAGGAAGIAAAFNTPLAGVVFAIEELSGTFEHRFSGTLLALPSGLTLGRLDTSTALAACEAVARGEVPSDVVRGRAGRPGVDQVRELHVLGGGDPAAQITAVAGPVRRQSCGDDKVKATTRFEVDVAP